MDIVVLLRDPLPNRMRPKVARSRRVAALEFPHRPGMIEVGLIEGTPAAVAELEGLVSLDSVAEDPFTDEPGILPISDSAFVEGGAARGRRVQRGHEFT